MDSLNSKCKIDKSFGAGALVQWLWEETHDKEVGVLIPATDTNRMIVVTVVLWFEKS